MRKLKLFTGSMAVLSALALVSCGGSGNGGDVSLKVWGPSEHQELLKNMVEQFKAANPDTNYDIKVDVVSESDAYSNLQKDVTSGADVYAFANDQLVNLIRIGGLAKLNDDYANDVIAKNSSGAVKAAKFGSDYYAYPYAADNGYFMYYNKSVLGTTTDNLWDILDLLKEKGLKFSMDLDNAWYDAGFFFATGCSYSVDYDADGKETSIECDFNSANGFIAGKAMIQLAAHDAFILGDDDVINAGFADGTIAAAITGIWNDGAMKTNLGDNYAAIKLPSFTVDGNSYQLSSFAGFKLMGVNPNSSNISEAHKLASFLTGEKMQKLRFEEKGTGPTNNNVAKSDEVKQSTALAALSDQSQYAVAQTSVPSNYWSAVEAFGQEVCAGTVTVDNLQDKIDTVVALIKTISATN